MDARRLDAEPTESAWRAIGVFEGYRSALLALRAYRLLPTFANGVVGRGGWPLTRAH